MCCTTFHDLFFGFLATSHSGSKDIDSILLVVFIVVGIMLLLNLTLKMVASLSVGTAISGSQTLRSQPNFQSQNSGTEHPANPRISGLKNSCFLHIYS